MIWIASHAEHAGSWPEESALLLGADCRYPLTKLFGLPTPDGDRRLLVLNACETAAGAVYGGLGQFGLGGSLAGEAQAVIAHLWPVDDLAACAFGVFLAKELTSAPTFFGAFSSALAARIHIGDKLADDIDGLDRGDRLAQRIRDRKEDYGNPLRWASPCFLE